MRLTVTLGLLCLITSATASSPGEAIYYACSMCHGAQGEGSEAREAPPLAGTPAWYLAEQLRAFRDGRRGGPSDNLSGRYMALFAQALPSEATLEQVAAFAEALPRPPQTEHRLHREIPAGFAACAGCHGPQGEGNEALGAPPIAGQPAWYLARQLMAFRSGRRGLQPGDLSGLQMRAGMTSLPENPQDFRDLVTFISELRHPSLAPTPEMPPGP